MKRIFLLFAIIISIVSCTKTSIDAPTDFTVSVSKTTFSVDDTVTFNITGSPDIITFYSGLPNSNYQYAFDTSKQADSSVLSFSTLGTAGSSSTQPWSANNISLFYSTNFSGIMDSSNIRNANWIDISAKANLSNGAATVPSGSIRLDSLVSGNTPIYLAFRYVSDTATSTYKSRKWAISAFNLNSYFPDTVYCHANNFTAGGFYTRSLGNPYNSWVYGNVLSITQTLTFNAPAVGSLPDEDWAISRGFNLSQYPSNLGIVIKYYGQSHFSTYTMTQPYKTPGTYIATFVARNQYADSFKTVVRQVSLTITP